MEILKKFTSEWCYVIFRIIVGAFYFVIGTGKLFGWFGMNAVGFSSGIFTIAGIVETIVGAMLVLGLFSRLGGLLGAINMLVAYVVVHAPNGLSPFANNGERALLYFATFLVVMWIGNGKFSLEKKITGKKKEVF